MKEFDTEPPKPILKKHYPIQQRGTKRWIAAQTQGQFKHKRMHNNNVEATYHQVIDIAKAAMSGQSIIYYERDMKYDKELGLYGMHSLTTPNFHWWLECDLCCDYSIRYAFYNCPYEDDIRKLMRAYPLDRVATPKLFQSDFTTFYENVIHIQDKQFILTS